MKYAMLFCVSKILSVTNKAHSSQAFFFLYVKQIIRCNLVVIYVCKLIV